MYLEWRSNSEARYNNYKFWAYDRSWYIGKSLRRECKIYEWTEKYLLSIGVKENDIETSRYSKGEKVEAKFKDESQYIQNNFSSNYYYGKW